MGPVARPTTFTIWQCHKQCQHLPWLEQPLLEAKTHSWTLVGKVNDQPSCPTYQVEEDPQAVGQEAHQEEEEANLEEESHQEVEAYSLP